MALFPHFGHSNNRAEQVFEALGLGSRGRKVHVVRPTRYGPYRSIVHGSGPAAEWIGAPIMMIPQLRTQFSTAMVLLALMANFHARGEVAPGRSPLGPQSAAVFSLINRQDIASLGLDVTGESVYFKAGKETFVFRLTASGGEQSAVPR